MKKIFLNFGEFQCRAELFNTPVSDAFYKLLPVSISLSKWGNELYGSIDKDCGEENLVPEIPPGGIAYTRRGNLLCVFFGQTPAWNVEHIGYIINDEWKQLLEKPVPESLVITTNN